MRLLFFLAELIQQLIQGSDLLVVEASHDAIHLLFILFQRSEQGQPFFSYYDVNQALIFQANRFF